MQGSIINKLVKRVFNEKVVTSEFKKEFTKAISIFILYAQSGQAKKKYNKESIIEFLEREGLGKIADDLRKEKQHLDEGNTRKRPSKTIE